MRRVLRGLVLRHRKSQRGQVKAGKQRLTLTEGNRRKCKVEGIDQPSLQILPHGGNTASDLDILVTRCLFRELQRWKTLAPSSLVATCLVRSVAHGRTTHGRDGGVTNPPYHAPTFVLTHYEREPLVIEGGTTFYFVSGGIEEVPKPLLREFPLWFLLGQRQLHGRLPR